MRFSPVLLAVLTASAAFGSVRPAKAQPADLTDKRAETGSFQIAAKHGAGAETGTIQPTVEQLSQGVDLLVSSPERTSVEFLSQVPPTPPQTPSESETPQQELGTPSESESTGPAPAAESGETNIQIDTVPEVAPGVQEDEQDQQQDQLQDEPGTPPAGSEAPDQSTPDQIEFGQPRSAPEVEIQQQPGQPTAPANGPTAPAAPGQPGTASPTPGAEAAPEPRVLVAEVLVTGAEGDLLDRVYQAIQTLPGRTTTRSQLQADINAIFATGFFSNVRAVPSDTPLGVRITFEVQPNPVLQSVQLQGSALETINYQGQEVPLQQAVDGIFGPQYGSILNLRDFQRGVEQLNKLYQDNGYVLAQVISAPQVAPNGVVTLQVAEGVVEDIQIRFLNKEGQAVDEEGNPIRGRTRDFIITREFQTQPGDVFNQQQIQADLQRAYNLGIFEDLQISLNPGQDPRKVDIVVNVTERRTGSLGASAGVSTSSGLFGAVSVQEQNLGGNNQTLNAQVQVGQRDLLFDVSFTDPWIGGDPNRTSYTVNAFGRQSLSLVFDGGDNEIELPNGDRPRVRRYGGEVSFSRPLPGSWFASLGLQYQNVSIRDLDGELSPRDEFGTLLSFNDSGIDNLLQLQFAVLRDLRNNPLQATSGSFLRFSTEQAIPIDGISFNRLRASYSYFVPVRLIRFTQGCQGEEANATTCPQAFAFNVQAGTIIGDFPPYEAFVLGGADSVRGYGPGELGSGSSFFQATAEYRFPIVSVIGGALFFDFGTNLGTGDDVPGDPSEVRDLPGTGFGYGVGIRVQSPLGQIRVDYATNDQGDTRFEFGIGERF